MALLKRTQRKWISQLRFLSIFDPIQAHFMHFVYFFQHWDLSDFFWGGLKICGKIVACTSALFCPRLWYIIVMLMFRAGSKNVNVWCFGCHFHSFDFFLRRTLFKKTCRLKVFRILYCILQFFFAVSVVFFFVNWKLSRLFIEIPV